MEVRLRMLITRSRPYLRSRDLMLATGRKTFLVHREDLARRYLAGDGIEIGALTKPLRVPPGVRVRYVDRATRDELLQLDGPALEASGVNRDLIGRVDVVDDAERLDTIPDASVDFVIANHVVEHLEDPITAIGNMLRVLRSGGILFLTLPDARRTFDRHRARTSVEHVLRDHAEGPAVSRQEHYEDWARHIEGVGDADVPARAAQYRDEDARHHFHCWELEGFLQLLLRMEPPARIEHAQAYLAEFAVILRRD